MIYIFFSIQIILIAGYRLRLDQMMYFQYQDTMKLEFVGQYGYRPTILLHSYSSLKIQANRSLIQIGKNESHYLFLGDECNCTNECAYSIKIEANNFSILVKLHKPIIPQLNSEIDGVLFQNYEVIKCIEFQIDQVSLILITLQNIVEVLEPFQFKLGKLNIQFEEIEIQQKDINTMYAILKVGKYLLFIIGPQNMLYTIHNQRDEIVSDKLIFLKQPTPKDIFGFNRNFIYLRLCEGSCELLIYVNQSIALQKGIVYTVSQDIFQLRCLSNISLILQTYIEQNFLPHEPELILINNNKTALTLISHYPINLIQQNTNFTLDIQIGYIQYYEYTITMRPLISYLDQLIQNQDIQYLYIAGLFNVTIKFDTQKYKFLTINGNYQWNYVQNGISLYSNQAYTIKFIKISSLRFLNVQLNTVYKFQNNKIVLILANNHMRQIINLFPQYLEPQIYMDSDLRQQDHENTLKRIVFKEGDQQYRYLLVKSDLPFYLQLQSTQYSYHYQNLKPAVVSINPYQVKLQEFGENNTQILFLTNQYEITTYRFNQLQFHTLVCRLNNLVSKYQQIYENEVIPIQSTKLYTFYLQSDNIALILQGAQLIELSLEINNIDIATEIEISNIIEDDSQQFCYSDNKFLLIFTESHRTLNLKFCECQKRDCIVKFSTVQQQVKLAYTTCRKIQYGLIQFKDHLFSCELLQQIDLLPIRGDLKIYRDDNFIKCSQADICEILIIGQSNETSLSSFSYDFILILNTFQTFENLHLKFLFYNNSTQQLFINSNKQYQLTLYQNDQMNQVNNVTNNYLQQGYYFLEFQEQISYVSIFTYPTILNQGYIFDVISEQTFTISKECIANILFEFIKYENTSIMGNFLISNITQKYTTFSCNDLPEQITILGNGSLQVLYLRKICYFISYPQAKLLENSSILIQFTLNQDCDFQYIILQHNNKSFQKYCIYCIINLREYTINESNHIQYDILSIKQFKISKIIGIYL